MTILVGGTKAIDIEAPGIDILSLTAGSATVATATTYRIANGTSFDQFTGTFIYDDAGVLIGGTITGWQRVTDGGVEFTATGISVPVNLFLGYLANGDSAAFNDAVFGSGDKMTGSATQDQIFGNNGNDTIAGGSGNDTLSGGGGDDSLLGGAGHDELDGGGGNDRMAGGAGDDHYIVTDKGDVVEEAPGQGIDLVTVGFDYTLPENVENLDLDVGDIDGFGNALDNYIRGGSGANVLAGDIGNDTLDGGDGTDTLAGGKGDDTYVISTLTDTVVENANEGTDTIRAVYILNDVSLNSPAYANIENLHLEAGANSKGQGNDAANVISGNTGYTYTYQLDGLGGNDTLTGGQGNDTLKGGTGADVMIGSGGDDTYEVDDAGDKVVEQNGLAGGFDSVTAKIDYVLAPNVEELNLEGAATSGTGNGGNNSIYGNDENSKLAGLSGNDYLGGGSNDDTLDGGTGDDTLDGGDGGDFFLGGAGNDRLLGQGGADTMSGGAGNDIYLVDALDQVNEGAGQGIDRIDTNLDSFSLDTKQLANVENLYLFFNGAGQAGTGNALNNLIQSGDGNDTLNGGLGNDTLDGGKGNDSLSGGSGNDKYVLDSDLDIVAEQINDGIDTVRSSAISYMLADNVENLVLLSDALNGSGNKLANVVTGNDEANDMAGFEGNDTLIGGKGDDALFGGTGANLLIGGDGDDWYVIDDGSAGDKIVETAGKDSGSDRVLAAVSVTLAANVEDLYLQGSGAISGTGNTSNNYLGGNTGNNKLSGLSGNDSINGDAGNDTLDGGAGNDTLNGEAGDDSLLGGAGSDSLNGQDGADTLAGGSGDDAYFITDTLDKVIEAAGQGTDTITAVLSDFTLDTKELANVENLLLGGLAAHGVGNSLNNYIRGSGQNDRLEGLLGNDTLDGFDGADSLIGGKGNDVYYIDDSNDVVSENAGEGIDTVRTDRNSLSLNTPAFANVENLQLLGAAVSGTGNGLANVITGNDFGNNLDGGAGSDTLIGGKGNDVYFVRSADDKVVELAGKDSGDDLVSSEVNYTLGANVERLTLHGSATIGTGNALDNRIDGELFGDKLAGLAGNDQLFGGAGNDTLDGGAGSDILSGGVGDDFILGGAGNDSLNGEVGPDTMAGGADTMSGGAGNDSYLVNNALDQVIEGAGQGNDSIGTTLLDFTLNTKALANVENLGLIGDSNFKGTGNALNNIIYGGGGNDTLNGGLGNDSLGGFGGIDLMIGGKGNDSYFVEDIGDTVTELAGEGIDSVFVEYAGTVDLAASFADIENLEFAGLNAYGNALSNVIAGSDASNTIEGKAGNDTLYGGEVGDLTGDDTLNGNEGNDSLVGGDGGDVLNGGVGVDTMIGGTGKDIYAVDDAKDRIVELNGADSGYDTVFADVDYVLSANIEQLNLGTFAVKGTGNAQSNVIVGTDFDNKLLGVAGNDSIFGHDGADTIDGGTGNDSLTGDAGSDSLLGGAGNDTLDGSMGADKMAGGAGNDRYIVGDLGDIAIEAAGQGTDTIVATSGLSYVLADKSNVEILELQGAADGAGNALANLIDGGSNISGDNSMSGGGGNDTLIAGYGQDIMAGGAGRDRFVMAFNDNIGDFAIDFTAGKLGDALDLSELLIGFSAGTSNANDFVKFTVIGGDTAVQVDFDGAANGANFVDVCSLQGVTLNSVTQAVLEGNLLLG